MLESYKWMDGWMGWKSPQALILRAPLCGANNRSSNDDNNVDVDDKHCSPGSTMAAAAHFYQQQVTICICICMSTCICICLTEINFLQAAAAAMDPGGLNGGAGLGGGIPESTRYPWMSITGRRIPGNT